MATIKDVVLVFAVPKDAQFGHNVTVRAKVLFTDVEVGRGEHFELRIDIFGYDWRGDAQPEDRGPSSYREYLTSPPRPIYTFTWYRQAYKMIRATSAELLVDEQVWIGSIKDPLDEDPGSHESARVIENPGELPLEVRFLTDNKDEVYARVGISSARETRAISPVVVVPRWTDRLDTPPR